MTKEDGIAPIRVMVVEDQPKILKNQLKLLQTFPEIEVVGTALSGEEAIHEIPNLKPDVLLLDLGLPKMSGIDVARWVKENQKSVEILIFTIFDEEDKVFEAIRAGASGYLLKGTPAEKILESIKDVFNGGSVIQPNLARALIKAFRNEPHQEEKQIISFPEMTLTERELEILQIIAKGLSNHEAAAVLGLSKATIRTHLEHIYEKLDVSNRVEAVTEGIRQGFIHI